jgi:uncharacterized membrane protein
MRSFLVDMTLFEIPAVVIILCLIGITVIRAFASSRTDGIDMFMRRDTAEDNERD